MVDSAISPDHLDLSGQMLTIDFVAVSWATPMLIFLPRKGELPHTAAPSRRINLLKAREAPTYRGKCLIDHYPRTGF